MEGNAGGRLDAPDNQVVVELANLNTTMNQVVFLLGKIMMSLDKVAAMLSTDQKLKRPSF
jgi:hypothetical protein